MAHSLGSFSQYAGLGTGLPSSTIQATISLDQPGNVAYTNLDLISGRVTVRCAKSADVSGIVVKLEGESRTRLMSPEGPNGERPKPQMEYHKILYRTQMVFPPAEVLEGRSQTAPGKASYTLPVGQHEYPFSFKLPFNNSCAFNNKSQQSIGGFDIARIPTQHVKKTLPPTLSGFPGEAEIRYYVKVTVNRHSVFKENPRAFVPFNFFPIESPRPPSKGAEVYGRQRHTFSPFASGEPVKEKMKGMFGKRSSASNSPITGSFAPSISVDARLPEPAILTCNSNIPLRLIVKKLNDFTDTIYLDSIQVSLIGHTKIRAHEVFRTESTSWIIVSKSNMRMPIWSNSPSDAADSETILDDRLWRAHPLPNSVAPSFMTCNIERSYQLDVRMGLSYGGSNAAKPQNIVLPLRLDTLVFSGIAPPAEVLTRMAENRNSTIRRKSTNPNAANKLHTDAPQYPEDSEFGANQVPPTPIDFDGASAHPPDFPPRPGAHMVEPLQDEYVDAPPSYEDALASSIPPISTSRPRYEPPPQQEDHVLGRDEKRGWAGS